MAMSRKRPFADPKQPYVYVWRLGERVLWVGHGTNNRCRPGCKSSWGGRPVGLVTLLELSRHEIIVDVIPFATLDEAREAERRLIIDLCPEFNTAPGTGGYPGMHTPEGLARMAAAQRGREYSIEERAARSVRMKGNKNLLGHKPSEETKAKISASSKGMAQANKTNPPRKGKKCSEEHRRKLSEAARSRRKKCI